jgi:hypothetical protein
MALLVNQSFEFGKFALDTRVVVQESDFRPNLNLMEDSTIDTRCVQTLVSGGWLEW